MDIRMMLQAAPSIAIIIESTLDVCADFTPASLRCIEKAINRVYPQGHEPLMTTLISYGIYLGEVFTRSLPGTEWGPYSEDIYDWKFIVKKEAHTFIGFPVRRVHNFWIDRSRGLHSFYQMNVDALDGKLEMELSEDWKNQEGEYLYRFTTKIEIDQ